MHTLFLIGPRGSGKSTVAKILGKKLHCLVQDADTIATTLAGMSVADLVAGKGWPAFREVEHKALAEAAGKGGIIATGGGIVLSPENRELMRREGLVFYLSAPPQVLAQRLMRNPRPDLRPALTTLDPVAEMAAVLAERDPLYRTTAHHIVDAGQSLRHVAAAIYTILSLSERTP